MPDLFNAFQADGYKIVEQYIFKGKKGIKAEHITAYNVLNKKKKTAYYVEGNSYEMGFLLGFLAHQEVERMCNEYLEKFAPAFLGIKSSVSNPLGGLIKWFLSRVLIKAVYEMSKKMAKDIPNEYKEELLGIYNGCHQANPKSKVDYEELWALNMGFDCLLALIYSPRLLERWPRFKEKNLRIPVGCNGFAVFGNGVKLSSSGHKPFYFGRDFMFPTASVFQDVATHIIYNPTDNRLPLVSLSAPGLVGSVTVMNREGIALGVDMAASGNCSPERPGFNSLILIREAAHQATDIQQAVQKIVSVRRGVSWIYLIADGKTDKACVVEAGSSAESEDFTSYPPDDLMMKALLPDRQTLKSNENQASQKGLMVRFNDYQYPTHFLSYNKNLFEYFDKEYRAQDFEARGYLCKRLPTGKIEDNLPLSFYFAPLRVTQADLLLASNHFLIPSMRLAAMEPWCTNISAKQTLDFQWRYDKLNDLLQSNYGQINEELAWKIVNFLAAEEGSYVPDYYHDHKDYVYYTEDGIKKKTKEVPGAISLCELKSKIIKSRWGYYADQPVQISLLNYI